MTPHQPAAEAHDMSGAHLPTYEELTVPREVAAGGLYNMRDLGRLPRRVGGQTRSGVFYRADDLSALTDAGVTSVLDAGVRTVIDLRRVAYTWSSPLTTDTPPATGWRACGIYRSTRRGSRSCATSAPTSARSVRRS